MAQPPDGGWPAGPNRLASEGFRRKSRFRRKHDIGKPIRPVTAFDVFFRNTYLWLKEKRPDLNQQQLFSEIGRLWREGTTWQDRQICYDYADWEKEVYDKEMIHWRERRKVQKERKLQAQQESKNYDYGTNDDSDTNGDESKPKDNCRQQ